MQAALAKYGNLDFEEIDILGPRTDVELRGWGSPTILVDGSDITGEPKAGVQVVYSRYRAKRQAVGDARNDGSWISEPNHVEI